MFRISSLRHFLQNNSIRKLFDQVKDYQAVFNGRSKVYTIETCDELTFADVAEANMLSVTFKIQDKFKNAALMHFINIFGETVIKESGEEELSSTFLREADKEVKMIYVDAMK